MFILRVRDPSLSIFNDLRVHVYCLFLWEVFLKKWVRLWKIEKKNSKAPVSIFRGVPLCHTGRRYWAQNTRIHVCTPDRRGDQREGLVGTAPTPLFVTNNPAGLVVPVIHL